MAAERFSIRRARGGDDERAILDCLRAAFEPYRADYAPGAFDDTVPAPEALRRRAAEMSLFVAVSADGEIAGTIACQVLTPEKGHLRGMAVHPRWHGSGVAEKLLEAAEAALGERGCLRVSLETTAIRFYERRGFRPSAKIADFFGMRLIEYVKGSYRASDR